MTNSRRKQPMTTPAHTRSSSQSRPLGRRIARSWWRLVPSLLRSVGPSVTFLHRRGWFVLGALVIVVVLFGSWGFHGHLLNREPAPTLSEVLYLSLQLFSLESGAAVPGAVEWRLEVARFLGAFLMVAAAARALVMFFYDRFQLFVLSLFGHDHVIVCGLGRIGTRLVDELRKRGEWVVVVESDSRNEALKRCREHGTTAIVGNASDEFTLRKVRVHRAKALVSVVGDDGSNVETAVLARRLNQSRRSTPLRCVIHVQDRKLRAMLANTRLMADKHDAFELQYFDVFELCARVMLRESQFLPVFNPTINEKRHIVVIGFGRLGETLVVRALRDAEIEQFAPTRRLRITVIDQHADQKQQQFRSLHPLAGELCCVEFLQMELHQPEFEAGEFLNDADGAIDASAVYVCLGDDSLGMLAALTMDELLRPSAVPVIVRMSEEAGFAAALTTETRDGETADNIRAVGLLELSCNVDLVLDGAHEILARAIHQGYVRHHLELGESAAENSSLAMWEELSEEIRESNRDRARTVDDHLAQIDCRLVQVITEHPRTLQFSPDEIEVLARLEHERWCNEQRRPSFDANNKPLALLCSTPWDECPDNVRQFNREMVAVMPSILAKADFEIRRNT